MEGGSGAGLVRAFVGVRVGEEAACELAELQSSLVRRCPEGSLRLVDPRDLHLTLRFLGDLNGAQALEAMARLRRMPDSPRFGLRLGPLACLPNARMPRVVYASVLDPAELGALANSVGKATQGLGKAEPERPFKAHATIARLRDPRRDGSLVGEAVRKSPAPLQAEWTVEQVELMATSETPGVPRYRTVFSRQLT